MTSVGILIIVAIISVICIACLTIIVYNQLLAGNEVNRRLIVLTQEAIEHDRRTCEDLRNALQAFDEKLPASTEVDEDTYTFPEGLDPDEL